LLDGALRVAGLIDSHRIASDRYYDVVDGAAGALQAALVLHEVRASDALEGVAMRCGDHLIASHIESQNGWAWPSSTRQHLVGYAHGSAGIAAALLRLFAVTGRTVYRDAAAQALEFVSGLFGEVDANWPVSKPDPDNVVTVISKMNAWCHGAPGIVAAAASAADGGVDSAIVSQARRALDTVERWGMIQADHLCCGHLGRADALLTAGGTLGLETPRAAAIDIATRVLTRARARRHFRLSTPGVEYLVFSPGFFRGLAGIGYQLLRLAAPERVASILFFGAKGRL
jgi:lantibiotic modifying enzyme